MQFKIFQDTAHGWCNWVLVNNANALLASSASVYTSVADAQAAVTEFQKWTALAPVSVISRAVKFQPHLHNLDRHADRGS